MYASEARVKNHKIITREKKILLPPGGPRYFLEEIPVKLTLKDKEYLNVWEEMGRDIESERTYEQSKEMPND